MNYKLKIAIAVACAAGLRAPANALGRGNLQINPYYSVTGAYDDNIYRVNRDQPNATRTGCRPDSAAACSGGTLGSWLANNNAGLKLGLKTDLQKFSVGYDVSAFHYGTQATANDSVAQAVDGLYELKGAVFSAKAWDRYLNTQDPPYNPNATAVGGELVARERRWQNEVGASAEYALGDKFFIGADGKHTVHKYLNRALGASINRFEAYMGAKLGYRIFPKTRVFAAGHRQIVHYSAGRSANHKDWNGEFGVEGELTSRIKASAQTGVQYRRYDFDVLRSTPAHRDTSRHWIASLGLQYQATQRLSFDFGANRSVNEAVTGGRFYTSAGGSAGAAYKLRKLTMRANGGMQVDNYDEAITVALGNGLFTERANRRDDLYTAGARVEYQFQEWLQFFSSYQHTRRHSIFTEQFNYRQNRTEIGMRAAF